jgi:hypothetical protein
MREREALVSNMAKQDTWPRGKSEFVNKYIKQFAQFINSIDFKSDVWLTVHRNSVWISKTN